ncbi:MAG: hypothetical protein ACP5KA_04515 [Desulfurococcaceae archaeon]
MITCEALLRAKNLASMLGVGPVEFHGIGLLAAEGIGRVAAARRLGLRERLARRVLHALRKSPELGNFYRELRKVVAEVRGLSCTPVLYGNISSELLEKARTRLISLRDYIVIYARDPGKVEVIGFSSEDKLEYPGLPEDLAGLYAEARATLPRIKGLVICWRSYKSYLDDALVLSALTELCTR